MTVDNPFTIPGLFGKKSSYGDYIESTCPATIPYGTPMVKDDCGEDTCYNCSYKYVVQYITSTWVMSQIKSGTKSCYYRCFGIYDTYNSPKTEEDKILIRDAAICFTLCNLGQQYIFQHLSEFGLDEGDLSQDGIDEWFHCPGPTMTSTCVGGYANTHNPDSWKCPDCAGFVMNTPFGNRQMNGFKCSGGYPKCFPYNDNWKAKNPVSKTGFLRMAVAAKFFIGERRGGFRAAFFISFWGTVTGNICTFVPVVL